MTENFDVTGMTCAACSARVDKCVRKLDGVKDVNVNLLRNSMSVDFDDTVTETDIINAVIEGGYGASVAGREKLTEKRDTGVNDEIKNMKFRLIVSIVCLVPLMYLSMGHMWHFPFVDLWIKGAEDSIAYAFTQFLLCLPVLYVNRKYFINGFKTLLHGAPNMDSLIAIGSGASMIYGVVAIYCIGYGLGYNNMELVESYMMNLYFEGAAMIVTLITLGKFHFRFCHKKSLLKVVLSPEPRCNASDRAADIAQLPHLVRSFTV